MKCTCFTGKDVYWYTREKDESGGVSSNEFNAIKAKEEELMLQVDALELVLLIRIHLPTNTLVFSGTGPQAQKPAFWTGETSGKA